jgi:superfamily II DNA helicase RecQ
VRMVVHYKSPWNLLNYTQESGRAGRDGLMAHSVVFWDPQDTGTYMDPNQNPIGMTEVWDWLH